MHLRSAVLFLAVVLSSFSAAASDRILVFAAASMKDAVEALADKYHDQTGERVVVSLASSGTLARQIEAGAPAEMFLSASPDWMDYLAARDLIDRESRAVAAGNSLVIVQKAGDGQATSKAMPDTLQADRFAMGDPNHVPAGIYARQALRSMGMWDDVKENAAFGENVRVALAMAARGDVSGAIVYRSDAAMQNELAIVFAFPPTSHLPIRYPVALTKGAGDDARSFLSFLLEEARAGALTPFGFTVPPNETDNVIDDG
ncbi:MAG: molybdate ABC transporter substrate-binding protein [Alphaproteobacteria bacterium]|nr:molybdate ABC transporter substrate-binding protein [Alphaproteobacteria bacterium]